MISDVVLPQHSTSFYTSRMFGLTGTIGVNNEGGILRAKLAQQVGGVLEVGSQGVEEHCAEDGLRAQPWVLHRA